MTLMAILRLGVATANVGILLSDRSIALAQTVCNCDSGILNDLESIIIVGFSASDSAHRKKGLY